jgi:hypothetical protein
MAAKQLITISFMGPPSSFISTRTSFSPEIELNPLRCSAVQIPPQMDTRRFCAPVEPDTLSIYATALPNVTIGTVFYLFSTG